jgi:heterodisulfide reductase subunit C/nitrate reductase gamma subunit
MLKQIIFSASLLITIGILAYTVRKYIGYFKLTKKNFPIQNIGRRISIMLEVAIGQTKIFRRPILGLLHALVFWGFCVILIGSVEMVIDGIAGTERTLGVLGIVYDVIFASGDVFAFIISIAILIFLFRRLFLNVKRFNGAEMSHKNHVDANIALSLILILMITLLGMNTFYVEHSLRTGHDVVGVYPVSQYLAGLFSGLSDSSIHFLHELNWWAHILVIFFFANYLPYSKHFHVYMSVPNVFLSRLEPLGYLPNMPNITKEVKMMLDPNAAFDDAEEESTEKFGVADIQDVSWKNYFDSLACTQCGRCTSVCPANTTGKKLSPRKIIMDVRSRMQEVGPELVKNKEYTDGKALLRDWISEEELWACTTCNACAQECPININHPTLIVDLRRYLVMEEAASPGELNAMFSNIENNGAPWQFNQQDRMLWAEEVYMFKK